MCGGCGVGTPKWYGLKPRFHVFWKEDFPQSQLCLAKLCFSGSLESAPEPTRTSYHLADSTVPFGSRLILRLILRAVKAANDL